MNILQLVTKRERRGAQVFARRLSELLVRHGHHVVYAGLYQSPSEPESVSGGRTLDLSQKPAYRFVRLSVLREIKQLVEEEQIEVIQANASDTLKYAVLARALYRFSVPIVYVNSSMASFWCKGWIRRWFNAWLVRRVDAVVSVSSATRTDFSRLYTCPGERISVIPIGLPIPGSVDRAKARTALQAFSEDLHTGPIVMHVGSFSSEKNHRGLLRVFRLLYKKHPDAKLVCIGEGSERRSVEAYARELPIRDNVYFLGNRNDVSTLLPATDVFLLPSLVEGLPGVLLEAQSFGVPIVAYDVGGVREAVLDGTTGYVVPMNDEQAAAERAVQILSDGSARAQMGQAARSFVAERFSIERVADQYEELYKKVIEQYERA